MCFAILGVDVVVVEVNWLCFGLLLCVLNSERVDVLWVVHIVDDQFRVLLKHALVLDEVHHLCAVHSHLDHLFDHSIFALGEELVIVAFFFTAELCSCSEFLLNEALLFGRCHIWSDVVLSHVIQQLPGHLIEGLFGQLSGIIFEISEGYKLHDVSIHIFLVLHGVEGFIICVEDVHRFEVFVAHSHDNYRDWQVGASYNLIDCLLHVIDYSISDDEQNEILLVVL